jgi:hypothetical protein
MGRLISDITDEIKPYIYVREGVDWYFYLHIKGGQGHGKKSLGGTHKFVLWYETPTDEDRNRTMAAEKYCEKYKIPFGHGNTIEEAYDNWREQIILTPLT